MHTLLPRGQFATMFLGIFDKSKKTLVYAAANSPQPIFMQKKHISLLDTDGFPLGILPNPVYVDTTIKLAKGDVLLLYSDALIESPISNGTRLGTIRFQRMVTKFLNTPDLNEGLKALLNRFSQVSPHPIADDVTAIMLRWE